VKLFKHQQASKKVKLFLSTPQRCMGAAEVQLHSSFASTQDGDKWLNITKVNAGEMSLGIN
jgi:hypothetical protein